VRAAASEIKSKQQKKEEARALLAGHFNPNAGLEGSNKQVSSFSHLLAPPPPPPPLLLPLLLLPPPGTSAPPHRAAAAPDFPYLL